MQRVWASHDKSLHTIRFSVQLTKLSPVHGSENMIQAHVGLAKCKYIFAFSINNATVNQILPDRCLEVSKSRVELPDELRPE